MGTCEPKDFHWNNFFFSDGPTLNRREFLRILYHNKAFVIVLY